MALVVGLGNPGSEYAGTRHNAGWWVVDELVRRWKALPAEHRDEYRSWSATVHGHAMTLMEPRTTMNLSGEAVAVYRGAHDLQVDGLLVVADDVYLPVGHLRLRADGSHGGHNGLNSIEQALATREFARLRMGVGSATASGLRGHVLGTPQGDEAASLERATGAAAEIVEYWLVEGIIAAMNRINRRVPREVSEP